MHVHLIGSRGTLVTSPATFLFIFLLLLVFFNYSVYLIF